MQDDSLVATVLDGVTHVLRHTPVRIDIEQNRAVDPHMSVRPIGHDQRLDDARQRVHPKPVASRSAGVAVSVPTRPWIPLASSFMAWGKKGAYICGTDFAVKLEPFDIADVLIHLDPHEFTARSTQQNTGRGSFDAHKGRVRMQLLTLHRKPPTPPGPLP